MFTLLAVLTIITPPDLCKNQYIRLILLNYNISRANIRYL